MDTSTMGLSEGQLRRQGLECLVAVLRSLVAWGTTTKGVDDPPLLQSAKSQPEDGDPITPDATLERLSAGGVSVETFRQATPDFGDDPTKFESAKQKKTTLLEGIKKFNYKPKRVSSLIVSSSPLMTR
jgi:brefeldin A-inhibited guanine nucleotide-exchange protein